MVSTKQHGIKEMFKKGEEVYDKRYPEIIGRVHYIDTDGQDFPVCVHYGKYQNFYTLDGAAERGSRFKVLKKVSDDLSDVRGYDLRVTDFVEDAIHPELGIGVIVDTTTDSKHRPWVNVKYTPDDENELYVVYAPKEIGEKTNDIKYLEKVED